MRLGSRAYVDLYVSFCVIEATQDSRFITRDSLGDVGGVSYPVPKTVSPRVVSVRRVTAIDAQQVHVRVDSPGHCNTNVVCLTLRLEHNS